MLKYGCETQKIVKVIDFEGMQSPQAQRSEMRLLILPHPLKHTHDW